MVNNPYEPPSTPPPENAEAVDVPNTQHVYVRYAMDMEDYLAFQLFHFRHSSAVRWHAYGATAFVSMVVAFSTVDAFSESSSSARLLAVLISVAVTVLVMRYMFQWLIGFSTRRMLSEGSNDGLLGTHELEILNDRLIERTAVNEHQHLVAKIDRIVENDDYIFLYITAIQAHVIPKRKIEAGNADKLLESLRKGAAQGA